MNEESIFAKASEIDDEHQRIEFIKNACAGNSNLLDRVNALVNANLAKDSLLDRPIDLDETRTAKSTFAKSRNSYPNRSLQAIAKDW